MTQIERDGENFVVPADLLAEALCISELEVKLLMRGGMITSRSEAGIEEDAGFWRLTFHHAGRACRFVIDETGTIVRRTSFPIRVPRPNPDLRGREVKE